MKSKHIAADKSNPTAGIQHGITEKSRRTAARKNMQNASVAE